MRLVEHHKKHHRANIIHEMLKDTTSPTRERCTPSQTLKKYKIATVPRTKWTAMWFALALK
jgi:hypothetical protein